MANPLSTWFLQKYAHETAEIRLQINFLVYTLTAVASVCALVSLVLQGALTDKLITGFIVVIFAVFLGLIRAGYARHISIATGTVLVLIFDVLGLVSEYKGNLEIYLVCSLVLFALVLTGFTAIFHWQSLVVGTLGCLGLILEFVIKQIPDSEKSGKSLQWDDLVITLALVVIASFIFRTVKARNQALVQHAEETGAKSMRQLGVMEKALGRVSGSMDTSEALIESSRTTRSLISGMDASVASARKDLETLSAKSDVLSHGIGEIAANSAKLRDGASRQGSAAGEAAKAVHGLSEAIGELSSLTQARRENVARLKTTTTEGGEVIARSSQVMLDMEKSASAILDIVKVINAVAAQTNLLAMNAAIEAAHAGEFGKGFSVVADEIRKLSEETGRNAKAVTSTVKGTIAAIQVAAENNTRVTGIFGRIAQESGTVAQAVEDLIQGLQDMASGTRSIIGSADDSVQVSTVLAEAVSKVDQRIVEAVGSLSSLSRASGELLKAVETIHASFGSLDAEAAGIESVGLKTRQELDQLKQALSELDGDSPV